MNSEESTYFHQYRYYQEAFDDEDEDEEEDEEEKRQSANHSSRILVEVPVEVVATIEVTRVSSKGRVNHKQNESTSLPL